MGIAYGFLSNDAFMKKLSVIMLTIFVVAAAFLLGIICRKGSIKMVALAKAIVFLEMYIETVLFLVVLCGMLSHKLLCFAYILPSMLVTALYGIHLISKVKTDRASFPPNKGVGSLCLYSLLGGAAGAFAAKALVDKSEPNTGVAVLLVCMTVYSCFIGICLLIAFVKLFCLARMDEAAIMRYIEYLCRCAEEQNSDCSMRNIEQAGLALHDLSSDNANREQLLCRIEQLKAAKR